MAFLKNNSRYLRAAATRYVRPNSELVIPGIKVWLRSKLIGLNNLDPVTTWNDVSANGINLAASVLKPVYYTNQINGKPSVKFDSEDDSMTAGGWATASVKDSIIDTFAVIKLGGSPTQNTIFRQNTVSGVQCRFTFFQRLGLSGSGVYTITNTVFNDAGTNFGVSTSGIQVSLNTWYIVRSKIFANLIPSNSIRIDTEVVGLNSTSKTVAVSGGFNFNNNSLRLGLGSDMDVAEIIQSVSTAGLDTSKISEIINYLKAEYAI